MSRLASSSGAAFALLFGALAPAFLAACAGASSSTHPLLAVHPAPPPRDDGKPAKGGDGGAKHAAALEELRVGELGPRVDKQNSLRVPLPDAEHWTRVKFWGVPSLVGFRYGKDHHAVVGAYVTHVDDNGAPGACEKSFEDWAQPLVEMFDVELDARPIQHVPWKGGTADLSVITARTATLAMHDTYEVTYAVYPVWGKHACLVVGAAIPARDEEQRAAEVRDRFAREVLPKIEVTSAEEPKERY